MFWLPALVIFFNIVVAPPSSMRGHSLVLLFLYLAFNYSPRKSYKYHFMNQQFGKYIIIAGIAIMVTGVVIYFFHNKLHWLGRLPGDIRIQKENFTFYFPITTMILVSIIVTILLQLFRKI